MCYSYLLISTICLSVSKFLQYTSWTLFDLLYCISAFLLSLVASPLTETLNLPHRANHLEVTVIPHFNHPFIILLTVVFFAHFGKFFSIYCILSFFLLSNTFCLFETFVTDLDGLVILHFNHPLIFFLSSFIFDHRSWTP